MIIEENQVWKEKLQAHGNSMALIISSDMMAYLGIERTDEIIIILKADHGKHGRFIGIGVDRNEKGDTDKREGDKDKKSNKDDASPKRSSKSDE